MGMKKKILQVAAVILLIICSQSAMAASAKCVIVKVEGHQMTIECKKELQGFSEGEAVKIKNVRKASIEGC